MRISPLVLVSLLAVWPAPFVAIAQSEKSSTLQDTIAVIQGLRDRRLFDLADLHAQQQIDSESIPIHEKSAIYLELIQTKVAAAIVATGSERETAWRIAENVSEEFKKQFPDHPQNLLVEVQDALVHYSNGNLIQQEIDAEILPPAMKDKALAEFRKATSAFNLIEREIQKQIPIASSRTPLTGQLTAQQLTNLKNNIRYRLATINLTRARLYDRSDRLNHVAALAEVLSRLEQVITQSNSELPLWWDAQIAKAACFRLQNDAASANKVLASLPEAEISAELQNSILTERLLAAIDFNLVNQFDTLLKKFSSIKNPEPELQLAALKLVMAQASAASGALKNQKLSQATGLVKLVESTQGRYWGRRAEVLLIGSVGSVGKQPTATGDFEILIRQGESAFRKQNFSDAAKAFDKAIWVTFGEDKAEKALQLAVRYAMCQEPLKQHSLAADKLVTTSLQFREQNLADVVHLRGCWNLARVAESKSAMIDALQSQIQIWPDSPSSDQARLWLGTALQTQKQWLAAFEAYNSVPFSSPHCLEAIGQLEACAAELIDEADDSNDGGRAKIANRLVNALSSRLDDGNWNDARRSLLNSMLSIGLPTKVISGSQAVDLLKAAGQGDDLSDSWRIQSRVMQLVAISINPSGSEPAEIIRALPNDAQIMQECYQRLQSTLSEQQFDAIGAARVMICDKALTDEAVAKREFWQIERLVAKVAVADADSALSELEAFATKYPKSLKIQLAYGRALTKASVSSDKILKQWRRLAAKVSPGSEAWFEAKYNVVAQLIKDGKQKDAQKLIKYMQVTTPQWDQSSWKQQFESLLE